MNTVCLRRSTKLKNNTFFSCQLDVVCVLILFYFFLISFLISLFRKIWKWFQCTKRFGFRSLIFNHTLIHLLLGVYLYVWLFVSLVIFNGHHLIFFSFFFRSNSLSPSGSLSFAHALFAGVFQYDHEKKKTRKKNTQPKTHFKATGIKVTFKNGLV